MLLNQVVKLCKRLNPSGFRCRLFLSIPEIISEFRKGAILDVIKTTQ